MDTATFIEAIDWAKVRADVLEHRAGLEHAIAQRNAEISARYWPPKVSDQEQLAGWQNNIDACDELVVRIKSLGV